MTSAINDIMRRSIFLQALRQMAEQEIALEQFALAGAMLYPNHRQDICITVEYRGLQQTWWIA